MRIKIIEGQPHLKEKRKVAAYCRVSTEHEEQESSLENQMQNYEDVIRSNPEYEYAGVYHDFGISGFKEERPGFQKMMEDARAGKIDLILTKSISRFARNTQTVLKATRELKELKVGVFFELQKINTLTAEGELMMTIIAAFAQAESEGMSAVGKMAYRRRYEAGIPVQYLERSFGYRKNEIGEYEIDEDEAKWVRKIYKMMADGYTFAAIKRYLNNQGVRTAAGAEWCESTVTRLVESEIYKGDYIMHKHFVNEDRKLVPNRGEVDSWYVENDHVPIVSKSLWQKAQDAVAKRREYYATGSVIMDMSEENYPYMNKVFCAECGYPLYSRIYSNGNRLNWGCSGQQRFGVKFCRGVNIPDGVLRGWDIDGNVFIYERTREKGIKEFAFHRESYWKRRNKKKVHVSDVPANTAENYPYRRLIFCAECGSRLVRHVSHKNSKVFWICNGNKRKGSDFCRGVRIPDDEVRNWMPIEAEIYITERRIKNGEKHYAYSGTKPERGQKAGTES